MKPRFRASLFWCLALILGWAGPATAQEAFTSDDFNSCSLNEWWTVVDPLSDADFSVSGAGSGASHLNISVPAGVSHNVWTDGNNAPRVMQPCLNTDFVLEAKFDSIPSAGFQMQGVIVQESLTKFLRLEFHHTGSALKIYAASIDGTQAVVRRNATIGAGTTLYMRITRAGNTWTIQYSTTRTSWTTAVTFNFSMNVTAVGPFAGNYTPAPAFTCKVDYFFCSSSPIEPEDQPFSGVSLVTQTIGSGQLSVSPELPVYYCGETVELTAIPAAGWQFEGWSGDLISTNPVETVVMNQPHSITATFAPDTTPLELVGEVSVSTAPQSVLIEWTTNKAADSLLEYGLTPSLELAPASDAALVTEHAIQLDGLAPNTTYYARVTSEDSVNNAASSDLLVFTTPMLGGFLSDDFNSCGISAPWTIIDPLQDATFAITGSGSGNAHLSLGVPAGVSHNVWAQANMGPRVMQPAENGDFEIEVKFDSVPSAKHQMQGVIVEQDANNFIRFDFHHNGSTLRIFAATLAETQATTRINSAIAGAASLYMRITRIGNSWTVKRSADGTSWTTAGSFNHALSVSTVGPFVGNFTPAPAFTALVDYFFTTEAPILPEDANMAGPTLTTQVIGQGEIVVDPVAPVYVCGETVNLTAVPAPGWFFLEWTGSLSGSNPTAQLVMSESHSVSAVFELDTSPLEIVGAVDVQTTATSATVQWTTNKVAAGAVEYGLSEQLELEPVTIGAPTANHLIVLTDLTPDTQYYARVVSTDAAENSVQSELFTFVTPVVGGFISDDFNACSLNEAVWTVIDPLADATIGMVGAGSGNAALMISVPSGASHDVWANSNMAPRVMQPAADGDFEIEVKFDSVPSAKFQSQGVIVEQDAENFMRFDFYHDGVALRLFAATFASDHAIQRHNGNLNTSTLLYMRIARVGDDWTLRHSADGQQWTTATTFAHTLAVTSIGPFAGNYNPAPAFTAVVDYFNTVEAPVVPEDEAFSEPGALLTAGVIGQGTIVVTPSQPVYHCSETVELTAVETPGWLFDGWTGDLAGMEQSKSLIMDQSRSVQANFVIDDRVLEILDVTIDVGDTFAVVTWSTSKPATSEVEYGLSSAYELGDVQSGNYVMAHQLVLTGLDTDALHHVRITSVDGLGASLSTDDMTFTTDVLGSFNSDDFNNFNLDPEVWTFVNPLGDAVLRLEGVNTPDARIEIDLPAGVDHSPWTNGNRAPRLMQQMSDVDFAIEARFEALMTQAYQQQGLLFEESAEHFLRFDIYSDGNSMRMYAAAINQGGSATFISQELPDGFPWHLRVERAGDVWRAYHSFTGANWTLGGEFTYAMTVNAAGPFVANAGSSTPAFTGVIDYVFNAASPIEPEDGATVIDTEPPVIFGVEVLTAADSILVKWKTDEPADGRLDYGLTTSYELGSQSNPAFLFDHAVVIGGLAPETTYQVRVASSDSLGQVGLSDNLVVKTAAEGTFLGPAIDVWYGDNQSFGAIGLPIPYVNILGKVDTQNLAALQYSLNGGPYLPLAVGSDLRRLYGDGDFNVEFTHSQLLQGPNVVTLRSFDTIGNQAQKSVLFDFQSDNVWPLPYTVHWADFANVSEAAQVSDGLWEFDAGSAIRPVELGYDRIVAIGDQEWTDYEVTVPVTVFGIDPEGFGPPSNGPAVGIVCHWTGHTQIGNELPRRGFVPLGAFGLYRWTSGGQSYRLHGNNNNVLDSAALSLEFSVEYIFKMRVENLEGQTAYRFKSWLATQEEPAEWLLEGQQSSDNDPGAGCMLLVSHHVDARFGEVVIVPLP